MTDIHILMMDGQIGVNKIGNLSGVGRRKLMSKKCRNKQVYHPKRDVEYMGSSVQLKMPKTEKRKIDKTPLVELFPNAILVEDWDHLIKLYNKGIVSSATHDLEIKREDCSGWIKPKNKEDWNWDDSYYLSTHTFYGYTDSRFGGTYRESTKALQEFGFNVIINNWDGETI